jgi:hypothetical protein
MPLTTSRDAVLSSTGLGFLCCEGTPNDARFRGSALCAE